MSESRPLGASMWEQEMFEMLTTHERDENAVIHAYEELADETTSDTVRYLVGLIIEDERRHHKVLGDLAANIVHAGKRSKDGVPYLDVHRGDSGILEETRRFLAIERRDRAEMRKLGHKVRESGDVLDTFLIDLLRADTEKHIRILRFIEHVVRHSPLS